MKQLIIGLVIGLAIGWIGTATAQQFDYQLANIQNTMRHMESTLNRIANGTCSNSTIC